MRGHTVNQKKEELFSVRGTKKIWGISITFKRLVITALLILAFLDLFGYYILQACGIQAAPYSILEHLVRMIIPSGGV